jgi:hypothetical protein
MGFVVENSILFLLYSVCTGNEKKLKNQFDNCVVNFLVESCKILSE